MRHAAVLLLVLIAGAVARSQEPPAPATEGSPEAGNAGAAADIAKKGAVPAEETPKRLSIHGQATTVTQGNWPFRAPYTGPLSLDPKANLASTATATLFLAGKLPWQGAEFVFNPEIAAGSGLSGTTGLAGFPNGEATRAGMPAPTPYVARALYRQVFGLGGGSEDVPDGVNQPATTRDKDRLTFQAGKFAAVDVVGDNPYNHDPRTQFLNWGLMFNGAWDFPANVRGYTYGGTAELVLGDWTVTYGIFGEPLVANGAAIDPRFTRANGNVLEIERGFKVRGRPARLRFVPYVNFANMGDYRLAVAASPTAPDITSVRAYRSKKGLFVNYEQELSDDVGLFARLGYNDGRTETWAYTEIDRMAALGLNIKGGAWGRKDDVLGIAGLVNGLSAAHRDYLAAGGVGFIVGDGRLNYAQELIAELFYNIQLREGMFLTFDFQGVANPAYNRDRGPVALGAVRFHLEY
jgi:high affinity Mn2+ porin